MNSEEKNCIFCKIVRHEIPSTVIYEDEFVMAFLDNTPIHPGHTLIIPKKHSENLYSTDKSDLDRMTEVAKNISLAIKSGLEADGVNIRMNIEKAAGQMIFHTHFHVIPRFINDELVDWHGKNVPDNLQTEAAEKIKGAL